MGCVISVARYDAARPAQALEGKPPTGTRKTDVISFYPKRLVQAGKAECIL